MSNAVVGIYRIDPENLIADFRRRKMKVEKDFDASNYIEKLMSSKEAKLKLPYSEQFDRIETSFNIESLRKEAKRQNVEIPSKNFKIEAHLFKGNIQTPDKWAPYFRTLAKEAATIKNGYNSQNSFLLFVIINEEIYVVSSGLSYHQISRYLDDYFGVTVLSHLIDTNITEIRSLEDNALYGNVLSSDRLFGTNYKIANEDSFGKVYKKILATVEISDLRRELPFLFSASDKRGRNCLGKTHFTLYKSISLSHTILLICKLHLLHKLGMNQKLRLSNIRQLKSNKASDRVKIELLQDEVITEFKSFIENGSALSPFSVFYKEAHHFLSTHKFKVFVGSGRRPLLTTEDANEVTVERILSTVKTDPKFIEALKKANGAKTVERREKLKELFSTITVAFENPNYPREVEAPLLNLIQGEVRLDKKTYYNLNSKWFCFEQTLASITNTDVQSLLENIQDQTICGKRWARTDNEHTYIEKYLSSAGYFPVHRVKPAPFNMELADIIRVLPNELQLIHIKDGFDCSFRELSSQVLLATRLLEDDLKKNSCAWMKSFYSAISRLQSREPYFQDLKTKFLTKWTTEAKFLDEIRGKKITFCVAYTGDSQNRRVRTEASRYASIIAKMSLVATDRQFGLVKARGWELKSCQIVRS